MTWRQQAACRGVDVNLFFSEAAGANQYPPEVRAACASCPVQTECLLEHLNDPDYTHVGFVGGLSPIERRELRVWLSGRIPRRRAAARKDAAKHGTRAKYVGGCRCVLCRQAQTAYDIERWERLPRCRNCNRRFRPHAARQLYCSMDCGEEYRNVQASAHTTVDGERRTA